MKNEIKDRLIEKPRIMEKNYRKELEQWMKMQSWDRKWWSKQMCEWKIYDSLFPLCTFDDCETRADSDSVLYSQPYCIKHLEVMFNRYLDKKNKNK